MPLVTITLLKGRSGQQKKEIGDVIHFALVQAGVPEDDRFQRFFNMEREDFIYSKSYPELPEERGDDFIMIEILLSAGRNVKIKRKLLATLVAGLQELGIAPKDVFVVFKETVWENWSFAGGNLLYA